ncbi:MAG: hypothetical protein DRJ42_01710 [Deltaproteobacteria bacterium]|nr:MAG: hypothetical protein DRJ42_01710 [Deltaproteobacteria bacterium]
MKRWTSVLMLMLLPACAAAMRPCFSSCSERSAPVLPATPGPPTVRAVVERCRGLNGDDDACEFVARFGPEHCSQAVPCDRLVVLFALSAEECGGYGRVLRDYAAEGYVAACVSLFESSDAGTLLPYVELADRVDRALLALTASDAVRGRWTGRFLFLSGAGPGATAPMVAMMRTDVDDAAHWRGAEATAACFLDGFYDLAAADVALGEGSRGIPCTFPLSHGDLLGRYYERAPGAHDCEGGRCPCGEEHAASIDVDSIVGGDASAMTVTDFKLIECGSELDRCTGDVAPAAPIHAFCEAIDAVPGRRCVSGALPRVEHASCMSRAVEPCLAYFAEVTRRGGAR